MTPLGACAPSSSSSKGRPDMFAITGRARVLLGGAVLSVLGLGVGATTGIVPRAGEVTTVRAAAADAGPRPADREEQLLATIPQAIELVSSAPAEGPTGESEVSTPASPQTGAPTGSAPEPEPESVPVTAPEGSEGRRRSTGSARPAAGTFGASASAFDGRGGSGHRRGPTLHPVSHPVAPHPRRSLSWAPRSVPPWTRARPWTR